MSSEPEQIKLDEIQLSAFYHDEFVSSQIKNFDILIDQRDKDCRVIVDIGGGVGHFGRALHQRHPAANVRVIDMDPRSVERACEKGVAAFVGDALNPPISGDEDVVCFNLILHHLVAPTEKDTAELQSRALLAWRGRAKWLFVDEYIYDSYLGNLSGSLIYRITHSTLLSRIGRAVGKFIPSLNANTFGVGVRFRSENEWRAMFRKLGFEVVDYVRGPEEHVSLARRFLFIQSCRRDSFLLRAAAH